MKMEKNTLYVSDCCNVESNVDHEICSQCGEHCTIIADNSLEQDYIPGLDDGEAYDPIMGDEWVETDDDFAAEYYGEEEFA
jgi:hypothetical protein